LIANRVFLPTVSKFRSKTMIEQGCFAKTWTEAIMTAAFPFFKLSLPPTAFGGEALRGEDTDRILVPDEMHRSHLFKPSLLKAPYSPEENQPFSCNPSPPGVFNSTPATTV
jgi:hypothetical protein